MSQPEGTLAIAAEIVTSTAVSRDLAAWATAALADGFDSPSLRILAGLDLVPLTSMYEAEPLFWRSLDELGIQQDRDPEVLLRRYARDLAARILAGRLPIERGLELIHQQVVGPLCHPWDLMPWCFLWEGNDPFDLGSWPADRSQIARRALEYARQVVELGDEPTELAVRLAAKRT